MQMRAREERAEAMRKEAAKPFARTRDDADLDAELRSMCMRYQLYARMHDLAVRLYACMQSHIHSYRQRGWYMHTCMHRLYFLLTLQPFFVICS